jgi:hypothetical protein
MYVSGAARMAAVAGQFRHITGGFTIRAVVCNRAATELVVACFTFVCHRAFLPEDQAPLTLFSQIRGFETSVSRADALASGSSRAIQLWLNERKNEATDEKDLFEEKS